MPTSQLSPLCIYYVVTDDFPDVTPVLPGFVDDGIFGRLSRGFLTAARCGDASTFS